MGRLASLTGGLLALTLAACTQSDFGSPCHLLTTANTEVFPSPRHDIVQSGNGECEQFVCVSFAGASPVCSAPCDQVGQSCGNGYVCQPGLLTPDLLQSLRTATAGHYTGTNTVDDFTLLTAGLTTSLYCGPKQ